MTQKHLFTVFLHYRAFPPPNWRRLCQGQVGH